MDDEFKDELKNTYTYDDIINYFDIKDENPDIIPYCKKELNVFSTNIFIPKELNYSEKIYLYFTGFIKLVELFQARTYELQNSTNKWMLYIYYDNMFNEYFDDKVYEINEKNNENNLEIKKNYISYKKVFKKLLQLYKNYIKIIKENKNNKYSFIKLFSFNCIHVKKINNI